MKLRFFDKVLNIFFPKELKCIFCGRDINSFDEDPICPDCQNEEIFNNSRHRCKCCDQPIYTEGDFCDNCKKDQKYFDRATSPFIYETKVKNLVLRFKNDNAKYLAEPMGKLMAERLKSENMLDFDIIIPVPLSENSLKKRGFNQAKLLADEIGKICDKPVREDIVLKVKDTKHQKELGFADRHENLKNAFNVTNLKDIKGKSVLIVDDVLTTCATTSTIAKLLIKHTDKIYVVSFARNLLPKVKSNPILE